MGNLQELIGDNPMVALIALCEIGFWVVLGLGLIARYVLKLRRTSVVLLVCTPLLDVVLLVAAALDMRRGGDAGFVHGLGAAYLGFSVVFGHSLIRWADQRVAHRFAGGPPPRKVPKHGPERRAHEWREWGKCVMAVAIAIGVILLLSFVFGTPGRTVALREQWIPRLLVTAAIWFAVGPLWSTFDRRSAPKGEYT